MESNKSNTFISFGILVLIFIQVMLSFFLIRKVNNLNETIEYIKQSTTVIRNPQEPSPPDYVENISTDDDPYRGIETASITIVEFADYQCPACAAAVPMIETLMEKYSEDIRFVYRDFPLNSHQNALQAAQAANCAGEQNSYWEMHNLLFSHQDRLSTEDLEGYAILLELDSQQFMECLQNNKYADEIQHDMADAQEYQVSSTPTFFINGHRVIGADLSQLEQTIDGLLGNQEE